MTDLTVARRAIRPLLKDRDPADAMAAYYAYHHPDQKTRLIISPEEGARADGFVTLARTGIDLFRPLITMRLPIDRGAEGYGASLALLRRALAPGMPAILTVPQRYMPLLRAVFNIQSEQLLRLYALDQRHFEPVINVLVTQSTTPNGLPRFAIYTKQSGEDELVAAASLNWQSPFFGEIAVNTKPEYRRRGWGRSVVSAMANYLLESGRIPLYAVAEENIASIQLAEALGFTNTGSRQHMLQATFGTVKEA